MPLLGDRTHPTVARPRRPTGTPRASLRRTRGGHSAMRGSPLWTPWTTHFVGCTQPKWCSSPCRHRLHCLAPECYRVSWSPQQQCYRREDLSKVADGEADQHGDEDG